MNYKIGFFQFSPTIGNPAQTIANISEGFRYIQDFDLMVLPELCNSGYNFESKEHALSTSEYPEESELVSLLIDICIEKDGFIVTGFNERSNECIYNTALLIGPEGITGKYRKIHLFWDEKDYFSPGNLGLPVFDIRGLKLGLLVCFDWIFPETWRILTLQGADIIAHPSNLVLPGLAQSAVPTMALMNRVYTITANRIGTEGDLTFTGMSIIAGPDGGILHQASQTKSETKLVEIDVSLARNKFVTPKNNIMTDRMPQEYKLLSKD